MPTSTPQTFVLKKTGEVFQSYLTEDEVREILPTVEKGFAKKLAAMWNRLSEQQYAWAVKMCEEKVNPPKKDEMKEYDFAGLIQMIQNAKDSGLKKIKVRLGDYALTPSRNGRVNVKSTTIFEEGRYGYGPKFYGWFTDSQTSIRSQEVIDFLEDAAQNPTKAMQLHGKITNRCGCCGIELTNPESILRGIGPICAEKFGLF